MSSLGTRAFPLCSASSDTSTTRQIVNHYLPLCGEVDTASVSDAGSGGGTERVLDALIPPAEGEVVVHIWMRFARCGSVVVRPGAAQLLHVAAVGLLLQPLLPGRVRGLGFLAGLGDVGCFADEGDQALD